MVSACCFFAYDSIELIGFGSSYTAQRTVCLFVGTNASYKERVEFDPYILALLLGELLSQ